MLREQRAPSAGAGRGRSWAVGACLLVALSPQLADWVRHLLAEPWARYAALFPLLLVRAARRDPPQPARPAQGLTLVALALLVELVAIGGGEIRLGRVALPLAGIGFARLVGFGTWPSLLLLVLAVPVPSFLVEVPSPGLEATLASWAWGATGGGTGSAPALEPADHGLILAPLLAGLSWYASRLRDRPPGRAAARAAVSALLAIPIQLVALAAAGLAAGATGDPTSARTLLDHAPWLATAAAGLLLAEVGAARTGARSTP